MTTPDDTTRDDSGRRTVVVTGGATGIGRATAAAFAAAGDDVYVVGRRAGLLQGAADAIGATPIAGDLADPVGVAEVAAALPARVDVLVNSAGGNTDFDAVDHSAGHDGDVLAAAAEAWNRNWAANVLTAVLTTTALRPRMGRGGRIVNVGSIAAPKGAGAYGAAKAALESWTVSLAADVGRDGITANIVAPGLVTDTEFFRGRLTDQRRERLVAATATGRAGVPDDIAAVIAFLASPGAAHVTAQVVHVNGGAHSGR